MGLYNPRPTLSELYAADNTVFNGMIVPTPGVNIDRLKSALLVECGELDTIFTTAAELKAYLPDWSTFHEASWVRILAALRAEYNPIHNYDRTDTETISDVRAEQRTGRTLSSRQGSGGTETGRAGTDVTTEGRESAASAHKTNSSVESSTEVTARGEHEEHSGERSNSSAVTGVSTTVDGGSDKSTVDRAGFNSAEDEYAADSRTVTEYGKMGTANSATTNSGSDSESGSTDRDADEATAHTGSSSGQEDTAEDGSESGTRVGTSAEQITETSTQQQSAENTEISADVGTDSRDRSLHSAGNIGTTRTQEMIADEIELRTRHNIYSIILEDFRREICVGVW